MTISLVVLESGHLRESIDTGTLAATLDILFRQDSQQHGGFFFIYEAIRNKNTLEKLGECCVYRFIKSLLREIY